MTFIIIDTASRLNLPANNVWCSNYKLRNVCEELRDITISCSKDIKLRGKTYEVEEFRETLYIDPSLLQHACSGFKIKTKSL